MGQVEWQKPPIRVGADAHIGPRVRQQGGRLIPASSACQVSGRCGHRPLREFGDFTIQLSQASTFRCPLHTRRKRGHPRKAQRAGVSLIRQGLRPATFPGGEGCLRRGITVYLLCCLSGISPGDSSTGCYTAVERGCEDGPIHKNTPQLFYKLWRNFLYFPGGSGGRAGERGGQFASFDFFSSYIQVYPQSFPGFPQNLSTAVDTAVDKFKSLFGITCSGRHRWLRHPSYRHPWPG